MTSNTLVSLLFAGTALVGGCAGTDSSYDRYVGDGVRIETGQAYRY